MQQHYGLSAADILAMSWRRFVVLFLGIFSWNEDAPPDSGVQQSHWDKVKSGVKEGGTGSISRSLDWDKALGQTPAASREFLTTDEFLGRER